MTIDDVYRTLQQYRARQQEVQAIRDNITLIKTSKSYNTVLQLTKVVQLYERLHKLSYEDMCCNIELLTYIAVIDDPRSRNVLIQRYVQGHTLSEVMQMMNASKSTYRRWHDKAVQDLYEIVKDEPF